jgi:hypothetical protein
MATSPGRAGAPVPSTIDDTAAPDDDVVHALSRSL